MSFLVDKEWFANRNDSCFANSVIVSMFSYGDSPFYKFIHSGNKLKPILIRAIHFSKTSCELRKAIQDESESREYQLSGQHDPCEFLDNFLKVFNYEPISIKFVRQSLSGDRKKIVRSRKESQTLRYIPISNDQEHILDVIGDDPSWTDLGPDQSNWKENKESVKMFRWTRNVITKLKGTCLIFHYNRIRFGQHQNGNLYPYISDNILKMATLLSVDRYEYFLQSCVAFEGSMNCGHYFVILTDRVNWYVYDDLTSPNPSKTIIPKKVARRYIMTKGILFFYYRVP